MPPQHLLERPRRAEIAGRMLLKESHETIRNLGEEYGVGRSTISYIVNEFKNTTDEAVAAARLFYEKNPRNSQPAARRGSSAQPAVIRAVTHSTHPAQAAAVGMQPFAAVAGQSSFFLPNEQFFALAQGLINGLTPNLIGLATQIAPTARDPSLGVQHAVPQAVNQQVPMQLYSGHAVQENASFIGYLQQQPISAAIAELPALTGGQPPMASDGAQEGSKQPALPGHSSTGGQHPMQSDSEERRKNPTPQVRWVWSPPASQIGSRIVFCMKQIASPFLRR